jgi:hypothetical protein
MLEPERACLLAILFLHGMTAVILMYSSSLRVGYEISTDLTYFPIIFIAIYVLSFRFNHEKWRVVRSCIENMTGFSLISVAGAISTYGIAKMSTGFVDSSLIDVDRLLGFDWLTAYLWLGAHPEVRLLGAIAYGLLPVLPVVAFVALAARREEQHARRFVAAYGICLYITIWIFAFFPCRSALPVFFPHGAPPYLTSLGYDQVNVIEALRAGKLIDIPIARLSGLVNFPSFHAASGVMFIWAAWPLRGLRWPFGILSIAMIMSTPIEGNHYLIDVIGGLSVSVIAIGIVRINWRGAFKFRMGRLRTADEALVDAVRV